MKTRQFLTFRIFLVGYSILFLELLLIRWISTEVGVLAYLQNSILIVCFLAIGMGLLKSSEFNAWTLRRTFAWFLILIPILSLKLSQQFWFDSSIFLSLFHDFQVWGSGHQLPNTSISPKIMIFFSLIAVALLLSIIWQIMMPLGILLGRLLNQHPNTLTAYSADISGGCLGGVTFALFGWASFSPFIWVSYCLLILFLLILLEVNASSDGKMSDIKVAFVALIAGPIIAFHGYSFDSIALRTIWTPYQKISVTPSDMAGEFNIDVNNIPFQRILNNSLEGTAAKGASNLFGKSNYDIAPRLYPDAEHIVVFGAGTGNDVAGVLRHIKKPVTAVEIDPGISSLGKQLHPEKPYSNPLVSIITNDARSYLAQARTHSVDLMIFGLLDSHTTPHLTSSRIDNFVYTHEAFHEIHRVLKEDGILYMFFYPQRDYIQDRIVSEIDRTFGHSTQMLQLDSSNVSWGGIAFINGSLERIHKNIQSDPLLGEIFNTSAYDHSPTKLASQTSSITTTDDWPFLYIERPTVPILFLILSLIIALLWVRTSRFYSGNIICPNLADTEQTAFFLMGAAFMLMQSFLLSRTAAVIGSTWFVNCIVISGMLVTIVLANIIIARIHSWRLALSSLALLTGLCLSFAILPVSFLHQLSFSARIIACVLLAGIPSFLSGITFGYLISNTEVPSTSLGANLFGAMIGGMFQYICFLTGFQGLALLSGGCYLATLYFLARSNMAKTVKAT